MKTILFPLLAIIAAAWGLDLAATTFPPNSHILWIVRQEGMYLTGLLSIALMSLSMLLATRPAWLEKPLGGLDRIYRLHKWSGILAISFGASHWLLQLSSDILKPLIGVEGRLPKIKYDGLLEVLRELGDDMGEPALYATLAMLAVTLWRRFPYHLWRHLHRVMPVLYLMLALHAALLAPLTYWTQPVGVLMAVCLAVGVVSSFMSLAGMIGRRRQVNGSVITVNREADVTELTCRLDEQWQAHRPGQFAFITFDWIEGAHPFTIASADRGDRTITFFIKGLGDFTKNLAQHIQSGQTVKIEGPYGRFQLARNQSDSRQIWVAGGIGVTPFLAWLESLQSPTEETQEADLHYCTRNHEIDPFVGRLQTLCAALPGIRLYIHSAKHGEVLTAGSLKLSDSKKNKADVWFCGPSGLADALKKGLKDEWNGRLRFHQEAFEMR
ncbi:ferredoxin reductase family protein [Propionivibrio sp.]|uniref:ferredoxin reductase family protein n=1 Tax=Propionivibrio sp. TaxID=2212460 RepID=UPI003BEFD4E7